MSMALAEAEDLYTNGYCGVFAYALWLVLGRPEEGGIGIVSSDENEPFSDEIPFDPTHAYLDLPDAEIDVYGARKTDEMAESFDLCSWSLMGPYDPEHFREQFLAESHGGYAPLAGGEEHIQKAIAFIQRHPERYIPKIRLP